MISKDWFKINGVSSDTVDIYVDTPPIPPMARQRYTTYEVGSDEDVTRPDDTYEDISYTITFYKFFGDILNYDNSALYAFLANASTLEISRLPNYYFKVRQVSLDNAQVMHNGQKIRYEASFKLSPFKYFTANEPITVASGDTLTNKGTRYSKPTIELTGTGNITLTVNGTPFTINMPADVATAIIDSTRLITYDKSNSNVLWNCTSGRYPLFSPGQNQIQFDATASTVKIWLNERNY